MKLNTYGIKMVGIRKVSGETKNLSRSSYLQLNYDKSTGEVWTDYFCDFGQNQWKEYHDSNIVNICNINSPMTMQEIADNIRDAI